MPSAAEEAVRDLIRVRAALLADRKRAQQRLTAMLLRHGRLWRRVGLILDPGARTVARRAAVPGAGAGRGAGALPGSAGCLPRGTGRHRG